MRISFFRLSGYKSFEYKPRYFDPAKEDLDERVERVKREMGTSDKPYTPNIKGRFKPVFNREMTYANRKSNQRLIIIFVILLGASYWIFGDIFRAMIGL